MLSKARGKRFQLILIKPSHYDADGYVVQWLRSTMPSNSLAAVYSLALGAATRQVLGPDLPIDVVAIDETNTRVRPGDIVTVDATESRQTFMKVGPRNAMVIAVVSLALAVDGDELRASYGSAGPVPGLVTAPLGERDGFPERVAEAASPIDDVRGSARYRRHALRVLTERALERCLA